MDPLSVGASIIAVIQCADRIAQLCRYYIGAVDDYPKDLRSILIEASSLKALLENLKYLIDCDGSLSPMLKTLGGEEGPLAWCQSTVRELESLFPASPPQATPNANRGKRLKLIMDQLAWPFRQEKARVLLAQIQQHKGTISLAISSEALRDIKETRHDLSAVCRMLSDSKTSNICTWVEKANPSKIHNRAVADYEEGTGDWITRTLEWKIWMNPNDSRRGLWVHGIPGAGKTVLASYAIREVIRTLQEPNTGNSICAYYYCHHAHNQDESTPALGWIVSQLCRAAKRVPEPLYESYRLRQLPSAKSLLQHLESILDHFERAFIIIDALDESQSRKNLLRVIRNILCDTRFNKIRLLVTSREYADIEREMLSIATPLSMSNTFVKEDIRKVVAATLRSNSIFQQWPESFRVEVEEALSSGANGMFRWAVCQLDILRRLRYQNLARETIKKLPRTLDETYERIFSSIAPEDVGLVRHCLWWTMFHNTIWDSIVPLTSQILIDTYYLMTGKEMADDQPLIADVEILKEACGCLLSFTCDNHGGFNVNLAHYTVREYLESSRSSTGQSILFFRDGNSTFDEEATALFNHSLLLEAEVDLEGMRTRITSHNSAASGIIFNTSIYQLVSCLRLVWIDKIKVRPSLVYKFLYPRRPHFSHLVNVVLVLWDDGEIWNEVGYFRELDLTTSEDSPEVIVMVYLLLLKRLDLASELLRRTGSSARTWQAQFSGKLDIKIYGRIDLTGQAKTFSGNIFELIAIYGHHEPTPEALGFLLHRGTKDSFDPTKILVHYIGRHLHRIDETCDMDCPLQRLLDMGADPNARGYPCTPLQIAVLGRDLQGVQKLLEAGADPNATGSNEAENWQQGTVLDAFSDLRGVKPVDIQSTLRWRALVFFSDQGITVKSNRIVKLLADATF